MYNQPSPNRITRHRDLMAARLSAVPGLGQLYKGHYLEAAFVGLGTVVLAIWAGTLIGLAYAVGLYGAGFGVSVHWVPLLLNPITVGAGLLPLLLFWALVAMEAFDEPDLRHRPLDVRRNTTTGKLAPAGL